MYSVHSTANNITDRRLNQTKMAVSSRSFLFISSPNLLWVIRKALPDIPQWQYYWILLPSHHTQWCHSSHVKSPSTDWLTMKFPRGRILKLPSKKNPRGAFDPEKLSFFIVIAFFSVFAVIFLMELYYNEGRSQSNNVEYEYQHNQTKDFY